MFHQPFACFPGEIEPGVVGIFLLKCFHDAQALAVVFKPAVGFHEIVERIFALVAEGGMPEVMGQSNGFGEVFIETEGAGDIARDGRHLNGVGEARA